jgi:hypothetical protein
MVGEFSKFGEKVKDVKFSKYMNGWRILQIWWISQIGARFKGESQNGEFELALKYERLGKLLLFNTKLGYDSLS